MQITIQFKVTEVDGYSTKDVALSELRRSVTDPARADLEVRSAIEDAQLELERQLAARRKAERAAALEAEFQVN